MPRTAEAVRRWASTRPFVLEPMRIGIANLTAVARLASEDLHIDNPAAVRAALRRLTPSIPAPYVSEVVRGALMASRIQTRSRVGILILQPGSEVMRRLANPVREALNAGRLCRILQGTEGIALTLDEDSLPIFTKQVGESQVIAVRRNLAELSVTGPASMADTRGLLSLLSGVLSSNGFTIAQATISHSDVIFLLPSADIARAGQLLSSLIEDVSASPRRFRRDRRAVRGRAAR